MIDPLVGNSTSTCSLQGSSTVCIVQDEPTLWQGYEITALTILFFALGLWSAYKYLDK